MVNYVDVGVGTASLSVRVMGYDYFRFLTAVLDFRATGDTISFHFGHRHTWGVDDSHPV